MRPIWKDIEVNLSSYLSNGNVDYVLKADGTQFYTGVAYANNAGQCSVRINEVVSDYLGRWWNTFEQTTAFTTTFLLQPNIAPAISLYVGSTQVFSDSVAIDWSYDLGFSLPNGVPACPVNGRIDPRMPLMQTTYKGGNITADLYAITGDFYVGDYNNDYSGANIHDTHTFAVGAGNKADLCIKPQDVASHQWIVLQGLTYKVVTACHRFALYYVNAYGGLDFLLMEGLCSEHDSLTRYVHKQKASNAYPCYRGKKEYANEIVKKYTLRTDLLTDEQAARMFHLVESTDVYLYDMQGLTPGSAVTPALVMKPVVITNTSHEYKTYKGEGRKMVQYTIEVEYAQDRYRKGQ